MMTGYLKLGKVTAHWVALFDPFVNQASLPAVGQAVRRPNFHSFVGSSVAE